MTVEHGVTHMELWFGLGALVLTLVLGFVLVPIVRKSLSDPSDSGQA